jgi:hypothetical protein
VFNVCPSRFIGPDVTELFQAMSLAGWTASLSEQASMPRPYRESVTWAKSAVERAKSQAVEKARSRNG